MRPRNFRSTAIRQFGPALLLLLAALLLWADSVSDVRPSADGAVENWTNTGATSCGSTDCWDEVADTSGATCSSAASDGDTGFNSSGTTSGTVMQYDIDESGIPDNSTVQSAVVRICGRKDGGSGTTVNTVMSFCVNGSCTDGSTVSPGASYGDFSSGTIDFADDVKTGADDYELKIRNTQARSVRISAIEADITYALPGGGSRPVVITLKPRPRSPGAAGLETS